MRVAGEEAAEETELVDEEGAEAEADHAGGDAEVVAHLLEAVSGEGEGEGDGGGHGHHAEHGSGAEDEQIEGGPDGAVDGGEDEQGDGRGAGEAVDEADDERAGTLIETEFAD